MKKIKKIEFKNFRVYKEYEFDIDTDKNIVLLYGSNGFGKTSFFDGIEWGFTGKLERYSGAAREKNEYPVLKNSLISKNEEGYVEILFDDNTHFKRNIRSSGASDYNEGNLDLSLNNFNNIVIRDAFKEKVDFTECFNFSHLLSQELLNSFIRGTKDTDRYKTVVRLFGLKRYEKFNPHFRMMEEKINTRLDTINDIVREITHMIKFENAKLSNLDIDPSIKMKELKILSEELNLKIGNEINNDELEKLSENCLQAKLKLEKNLTNIDKSIEELEYLHKNFIEKEETSRLLGEKKRYMEECINAINLLKYYDALCYIKNNLSVYNDYTRNKEQYDETLASCKEFKSSLLYNPLFITAGFDSQLTYIAESGEEYKVICEKYNSSKKSKDEIDQEIIALEKQLSEKFGLEKKLLKTAYDFLKENLNIGVCPVCQNNFNLSETLKQLKERLMSDYSPLFNELVNELEEKKALVAQKKVLTGELESHLKDTITGVKNKILDKEREYEAQVREIGEKSEIVNNILSKSALFKLSTDESFIDSEYINTRNVIESSKLSNDINYYILLKQEQEKSIDSLESSAKKYLSLKEKYNVINVTGIEQLLRQKKDEQNSSNTLAANYSKVIRTANELLDYTRSISAKEVLDKLLTEKNDMEKEKNALHKIRDEYENIQKSVRKVIEHETKDMLNRYLKNIRKMYSYLNPHLYLKSFDIKIDDSNPLNNRLIFEVFNVNNKKVNPSYIFSSAQNNVLALSIFLSFAFYQDWSDLNFVCLDDPIQNMDDINVSNFVDIIRALIEETDKQIYFSTHDDRIYNFMLKKFRGNVQAFRFTKYGEAIEEKVAFRKG